MNNVERHELLLTGTSLLHRFDGEGRGDTPRRGPEGAPDVWIEIEPQFADALLGMEMGHELIGITWLHAASRDVLKGHPPGNTNRPLTASSTRSPARPNPIALHLPAPFLNMTA